jgi:hypothetical protein
LILKFGRNSLCCIKNCLCPVGSCPQLLK